MKSLFLFVGRSAQNEKIKKVLNKFGYSSQIDVEDLHTAEFFLTNESDINRFTGVFITNRDSDHEPSLKHLMDLSYNGYIFLEKPIFQDLEFEKCLKSFNATKTYVNLPMRFTNLYKLIEQRNSDATLGRLLHSRVQLSYGIAFKPEMASNWRFSSSTNSSGVVSTLGIHYVDLFRRLLGEIQQSRVVDIEYSQNESDTSVLTGEISLQFENSIASILLSYESPYQFSVTLTFTNALVEIRDQTLNVYHPRDTFNPAGHFISPPISETVQMDVLNWDTATEESVVHFMEVALNSNLFENVDWLIALEINRVVCDW